jgi:hypothetical protein
MTPQAPQLSALLAAVSHPFDAIPSQFRNPALQATYEQDDAVHAGAVTFSGLQIVVQPPQ